ncbi:MAG: iron-containing alcohol dehydrogenase [Verrucomicrobia bacterium]|nr:iron-containing alcohol dehydrogenase [Verrucomicrobiota bacterium]
MNPEIQLTQPRRIVFGDGCAVRCAEEVAELGLRRVLVLTSPVVRAAAEPLLQAIRAAGSEVEVYAAEHPEPTFDHFAEALAAARAYAPDAVIGFGGGSVLDLAKLVAALHPPEAPDVRSVIGIGLLRKRSTFLACLPTTAGTGSEVSPNSILLDSADLLKKGIISRWLMPDSAYVDPLLTVSMPPAVTASTGIDALVHCIEAFANRHAHPAVDLYALEGVRLISSHLRQAVRDGRDRAARGAVARGSMYGGLCLGPVNTAAVHALAYPLGGEFHLAHGVSNALLLVPVLRFNLPAAPGRYAAIARALGAPEGRDDAEAAARGLALLDQLCTDCGIPRRLSTLGIPAEAIPRLARGALTVQRLLRNNPREVTLGDAEQIYRDAF